MTEKTENGFYRCEDTVKVYNGTLRQKTNIRIGIIYKRLEHIMRRIEDIEENGKGLSKRADERMDRFEQRMTDTEGFMGAIDKHHSKSELKINERMDRIDHEIRTDEENTDRFDELSDRNKTNIAYIALLSKRIDGVVEIGLDIVQQLKAIDRGMNNMSNHLAEQFNSLYRLDERMAEHDEHINKAMNKVECFKKKGD